MTLFYGKFIDVRKILNLLCGDIYAICDLDVGAIYATIDDLYRPLNVYYDIYNNSVVAMVYDVDHIFSKTIKDYVMDEKVDLVIYVVIYRALIVF